MRAAIALALVAAAVAVASVGASSCTVYVSPSGSDSTGTGSAAAPFATLWRALNATDADVWTAGAQATVCYAAGTYARDPAAGAHWTQSCNTATGVAGYASLTIRGADNDGSRVVVQPNGLVLETCKPLRLGNVTLTDELTVDVQAATPEGTATTFEWLVLTGNVSLTFSADHDAAFGATAAASKRVRQTALPRRHPRVRAKHTKRATTKARAAHTPGDQVDAYPFYFVNSVVTACTRADHAAPFPIWAYNHGSGSMHVQNVSFTRFATDVEGQGPPQIGRFESADLDAATNNELVFTNVTVSGNRMRGGLDITGGDVLLQGVQFTDNYVPSLHAYALGVAGHTVAVRDSQFYDNTNSGVMDIEVVESYIGDTQFAVVERCAFAHNSIWLHQNSDGSGFVYPAAVAIDTSITGLNVTVRDTLWDCNVVTNGTSADPTPLQVYYAPPIGVRNPLPNAYYTPIVSGNTIASSCPVQCIAGTSPSGIAQFSPCGLFDCTVCPEGLVPTAATTGCTAASDCVPCGAGTTIRPDRSGCDTCPAGSFIDTQAQPAVCSKCPSSFWRTARKSGSMHCNDLTGGAIGVIVVLSVVSGGLLVCVVYALCKRRCLGAAADDMIDSKAAVRQIQAKPLLGDSDANA